MTVWKNAPFLLCFFTCPQLTTHTLWSKANSAHAVTAESHHRGAEARRAVVGAVWPGGPAAGLALGARLDPPGLLVGSSPALCWGLWSCVWRRVDVTENHVWESV